MLIYVLKRVVDAVTAALALTFLTLTLMSFSGDAVARVVLGEQASAEQVAAKAAELGLDQPLIVRYLDWLTSAVTGDLGRSWVGSAPVSAVLMQRMPVSLSLVIGSTLLTIIVATVIGLIAATRRGAVDRILQSTAVVWFAIPSFWLAIMLVSIFALSLNVLPATGYVPIARGPGLWLAGLILPVIALSAGTIASTAQQVRGAAIDVLSSDYVRTLRARGISPASVMYRHVLRNAAVPALTVISLQFVGLLGGSVMIEKVFALPGIGEQMVTSALASDMPMVLGIVLVMVVLVVIVNVVIDILNGMLNPKVRVA